ncbi:mitochondrial coenzyme A transporter SLC25A42-like isoform X2 [Bolinopsis microptera]|uniref:mitochondrial coenzyme A transporter SLC25A42-like isoform X2 n=2 Tax=Bolinopsis microptera TaxID=2820187 RepID=UPI00307A80C2
MGPQPRARTYQEILGNFVSGATAGAVAKTTIAPLDRAKIVFQVSSKRSFSYRKCVQFLASTVRENGVTMMWKGNSATMVRIVPYAAITYMSNESYKDYFKRKDPDGKLSHVYRFCSGSMAGLTASFSTYGLEVLRARMAVKSEYVSILQSLKYILKTEGVSSLYRGLAPTLIGVSVYGGTSFYVFGTLKNINPLSSSDGLLTEHRLLYGGFAGLCGQSISYPLDVTRRRMQTGGIKGDHLERYSTMRGTLSHIYQNEGIKRGLYKGLSLNFLKGPLASSISFTVFDYMNTVISGYESY